MLKAQITKISSNVTGDQLDIEVTYTDEEFGLSTERVFTIPFTDVERFNRDEVLKLIQSEGQRYKQVKKTEAALVEELDKGLSEEIVIE